MHELRTNYLTSSEKNRVLALGGHKAFHEACQEGGQLGSTDVPDPTDEVEPHFVCFVVVGGSLYLLDGDRKAGPAEMGTGLKGNTFPDDFQSIVKEYLKQEAEKKEDEIATMLALVQSEGQH